MKRNPELDKAFRFGRMKRIAGLDIFETDENLCYHFGFTKPWQDRYNVLLDECERGWHFEDDLRSPADE